MQQSIQNQAQNVLTFLLLSLTVLLAYRLFSDNTDTRKAEPYTVQKRTPAKRGYRSPAKQAVQSTKQSMKKPMKESLTLLGAKKDIAETLSNHSKSLTSSELLPSKKDGWNDCNNYVPEYAVDFERERPKFILEEPCRNQDLQLGRTTYTIKKNTSVSPWGKSTISQQKQGFDEPSEQPCDDSVVVVSAAP